MRIKKTLSLGVEFYLWISFICILAFFVASSVSWAVLPSPHSQRDRNVESSLHRNDLKRAEFAYSTLVPPLQEKRHELALLLSKVDQLRARSSSQGVHDVKIQAQAREPAHLRRVFSDYERRLSQKGTSEQEITQFYSDYSTLLHDYLSIKDELAQRAREYARSVSQKKPASQASWRLNFKAAESYAKLTRAYADVLAQEVPEVFPEARVVMEMAEIYSQLLGQPMHLQNDQELDRARADLIRAYEKLVNQWRFVLEGESRRRLQRVKRAVGEGHHRTSFHAGLVGRAQRLHSQAGCRDQSTEDQSSNRRELLRVMDQLGTRWGLAQGEFDLERSFEGQDTTAVESLPRDLGVRGTHDSKTREQRQEESLIQEVIAQIHLKKKEAVVQAGGATGAKLLKGRDGKIKFVAKSLVPPKENLAHWTVQKYLPKIFDHFKYVPRNEIVVPQLAEVLELSPGLIPKSRLRRLPLGKSFADQDFVLIDFRGGKKDFSKKGAIRSREYKESMRRLVDPAERASVTEAALFSLLVGNVDLHEENILINKDSSQGLGLTLIDFGLTLPLKNPSQKEKHKRPVFSDLDEALVDRVAALRFLDHLSQSKIQERLLNVIHQSYAPKHSVHIQEALIERVDFLLEVRRKMLNYDWTPSFQYLFKPLDPSSDYQFS